jgi:4-diphosphocytidyl-2-C-methyl-D-erythritol kinase
MPQTLTRSAHAKVNLILSVGPPRPASDRHPGWHDIASWMHAIDLCDEVEVSRLPEGSPSQVRLLWAADAPRPSPIDWPIEMDLAARAHRAVEQAAGRPLPARIVVRKRIPVGSGLGGGSSDCAAVLLALRELFVLPIPDESLVELGASLGSDVPFFLDDPPPPRPALVCGLGAVIERLARSRATLILIFPPFSCPTREVYHAYDEFLVEEARRRAIDHAADAARRAAEGSPPGTPPRPPRVRTDLVRRRIERCGRRVAGEMLFNDLSRGAFRIRPELGALNTALSRATRLPVHLTGSGSTLFLITTRPEKTLLQVRRVLPPDAVATVSHLV